MRCRCVAAQHGGGLRTDGGDDADRQGTPAGEHIVEIAAIDEFHDEIGAVGLGVGDARVIDRGCPWMADGGHQLRFPPETSGPLGVRLEIRVGDLHRDTAFEVAIESLENLSHATGADLTDEVVAAPDDLHRSPP